VRSCFSFLVVIACRFFGGMINDIKNCYHPMTYISMLKDGFNMQCLASIIFLFFACISPIVTFGGLMGQKTDGHMVSFTRTKTTRTALSATRNAWQSLACSPRA